MKKILSVLLALFMFFSVVPSVNAASTGDLTFKLNKNGKSYYVYRCKATASGALTIPSKYKGKPVTNIDYLAFLGCGSLTSITIPDSITSIGKYTFSDCDKLASVKIGKGVTSIGAFAFQDCDKLTSITIPASVKSIGDNPFDCCISLASIKISSDNKNFSSNSGTLFNKEKTKIICCPAGKKGSYTIPKSVTSIGNYAFGGCDKLTSVTIGKGVKSIGVCAFYNCDKLASVTIPDNVTSIDDYAFEDCDKLTSVTLGKGVKNLGRIFYNCSSLTSLKLSNGLKSIGGYAFYGCNKLTSVVIPNTVTIIGDEAFYKCSNLTSVTIPDSVLRIGNKAFKDCKKLISVVIPSAAIIGEEAFYKCSNLTSVTIGNGVTYIYYMAFNSCSKLANITISDSVTSIESSAFDNTAYYNNSSNWENGVLYIGNHLIEAKNDISGAYTVKSGTKTIADFAFSSCESLTSVKIPDSITGIGSSAFYNTAYYNKSSNWKNGVLYIGNHLIEADTTDISGAYTVKSGTKTIAGSAFECCINLTSITIPDSVTYIGRDALLFSALTSISVSPKNKMYVSKDGILFNKNKTELIACCPKAKIKSVKIPDSVKIIVDGAFWDCDYLESITLGNGINYIGQSTFASCSNLKSVKIPDGVTGISDCAFQSCFKLASITIPASVTSMGDNVFRETNSVTIYGKNGSHIHRYAENCDIPFKTILTGSVKVKLGTISNTSKGVSLNWSKVANADGYIVYRKKSTDKSFSKLATVKSGSTVSYTDKTVKNGTKYTYTVKAYNAGGDSSYDKTGKTILFLSAPATKVAKKSGYINVTWGKISSAKGYVIYKKTGSGSYKKLTTIKSGSTVSYNDKSVKSGTKYIYYVKAYNGSTYSGYKSASVKYSR